MHGINHGHLEATELAGPRNFQYEPDAQGRTNFYPAYPFTEVAEVDREKGAGESGMGAGVAAVIGAVNDAVVPLGARLHELPLTPPRVLSAVKGVTLT
ncbi:hypothetical protein GCM10022222_10130 [Amycolatopsis ultiminotia]|uniref:Uncharacterized protein n=2 Tax=Amycolatopsis ultiminotia TaxID=543629 RepID=A0ABP6V5W1_9PSEU